MAPNKALRQQGFSVVELLVVIAVMAILLGISATKLQGAAQRQRLNEATRNLSDTLLDIADKAASESRYIVVTVSATNISWKDKFSNQSYGKLEFPHGATVTPAKTFEYTGRGLPPEGPEAFVVTTAAGTRTVNMLATGAVIVR